MTFARGINLRFVSEFFSRETYQHLQNLAHAIIRIPKVQLTEKYASLTSCIN